MEDQGRPSCGEHLCEPAARLAFSKTRFMAFHEPTEAEIATHARMAAHSMQVLLKAGAL